MACCFAKLLLEMRGSCLLLTPRHRCVSAHTVSFSPAPDRADLAVDLEVTQKETAKSLANAEVGPQTIKQKAAQPASSFSLQPSRKLQRSITKFHNADFEERLHRIESAESLLSCYVPELDGCVHQGPSKRST